jgi:NodT family efflux transporter outer membrane factor (OMF) lipoprotein
MFQAFITQIRPPLVVLGILLANGCTVLGPDYQEPEVAWLEDWRASAFPTATDNENEQVMSIKLWWKLFSDPVLTRLVDTANRNNLQLRIAGLRILESRAVLGIAGSSLYPQVQQATGALAYVNNSQHGGTSLDRNQSFTNYQLGFNLSWEIDFWGKFKRGIESADAAFFASIENQHDLQVLLNAQLTDLYFAYRTTQIRITIAHDNAALQKRSYEITEQLYTQGQQSELDLQQARTQYLATLATIPELESTLIRTRNAIAVLLGRPPGELSELLNDGYQLPRVEANKIKEIPARLLIRRPDIRAAAWQVAAQSAQIGIAEADFYPTISLLGSIGLTGQNQSSSPDIFNLTAGPSLRWNIFDHGRIQNNVRIQDVRLQQLIENYQDTALQAARQVDDAAISVVKTAETDKLVSESVQAARRSLDIANIRYSEGYADFQRVIDAQRAYFTQTERQIINHSAHISAIINLYKSLGGGWEPASIDQLIPDETRKTMQDRTDWGDLLTAPLETNPVPVNEASTDE